MGISHWVRGLQIQAFYKTGPGPGLVIDAGPRLPGTGLAVVMTPRCQSRALPRGNCTQEVCCSSPSTLTVISGKGSESLPKTGVPRPGRFGIGEPQPQHHEPTLLEHPEVRQQLRKRLDLRDSRGHLSRNRDAEFRHHDRGLSRRDRHRRRRRPRYRLGALDNLGVVPMFKPDVLWSVENCAFHGSILPFIVPLKLTSRNRASCRACPTCP